DLPGDGQVLLVMGGSQGATTLNRAAVGLAVRWRDRRDRFIVLKTGAAQLPEIEAELAQHGCAEKVRAVSFLERMDLAYAAADARGPGGLGPLAGPRARRSRTAIARHG